MRRVHKGFTLIELMVTVAIVGILAAIAIPAYGGYIAKAKRSEAQLALSSLAQAMERYAANNGTYCGAAGGGVGVCNVGAPTIFAGSVPTSGGTAYYNLRITALTASTYTLQAQRTGSMGSDKCGTLWLTSSGIQGISSNASGTTVTDCWRK